MKPIIVATDYSEGAENALKYAAYVARFTRANIILFNSFQISIHAANGLISPEAFNELIARNKERLNEYAEHSSEKLQVAMTVCSNGGVIENELNDLAETAGASMIVMGMRGNSTEYKLFGNTTTAVISEANVPVLVIPESVVFKLPQRILYACDYTVIPGEDELKMLNEIVNSFKAELCILHVGKEADLTVASGYGDNLVAQQLETHLQEIPHSYRDVSSASVVEGIRQVIEEYNADILVMSPHKYGFWQSLFHKSKTREMVLTGNIPLLVLPE